MGYPARRVHSWLGRYERDGLTGLADHSHRPRYQPRQLDAGIEALICQWRGVHPRWVLGGCCSSWAGRG